MFTIRLADSDDAPAVARLVYARSAWLEERGLTTWRDSADDLAAQAGNGHMWVLEATRTARIVGCTTVADTAPPWGWTEDELAEKALYLYSTVTDPAWRGHRPGTLMALWAVQHAHDEGRAWVRRGCMFPELVRHYRTQGFALVHEVQRTHRRVHLMARRAEPIPEFDGLLAGGQSSCSQQLREDSA